MKYLRRHALFLLLLVLASTHAWSSTSIVQMTIIIFFEVAGHEVAPDYIDQINRAQVCVAAMSNGRIEIVAYTDRNGPVAANLRLSQRRADAVAAALMAVGIPPERISKAEGLGENDPMAGNTVPAFSRRAEVLIFTDEETAETTAQVGVFGPRQVNEGNCDEL